MENRKKPELVQRWIANNPELIYDHASGVIFCTTCEAHINATRKYNVDRHIRSATHQGSQPEQLEKDIYFDFIQFLILCNIPWSKVSKPAFQSFFRKYVCWKNCCTCSTKFMPSETTLRKKYLNDVYESKIKLVCDAIGTNKLWISIDETTDYLGRYVVHLLAMPLTQHMPTKPLLIACKMIKTVNGDAIVEFIIESFKNLWPESYELKLNNVLMLCTDSVAYMLRAGRILKNLYSNIFHVTCLAHGINRVAEQVRGQYPNVDMFIANVKKVFLKSPNRIKNLKDMYPELPLPPQPVITRWGTWLKAATYYAKHFEEIKNVLNSLSSTEALSIRHAKQALDDPSLQTDLNYIDENFNIIQIALTKLQKRNLTIIESLEILDEIRSTLNWVGNEILIEKLEKILDRNPDYESVREISEKIVKGVEIESEAYLKYAPITSVEVERSFSIYKWILDNKRNRLKPENIEKIMVIYFNSLLMQTNTGPSSSDR